MMMPFDIPFLVKASAVFTVLINVVWIARQYLCWRRDFARRPRRIDENSPSNKPLPRTSKDIATRIGDGEVAATLDSHYLERVGSPIDLDELKNISSSESKPGRRNLARSTTIALAPKRASEGSLTDNSEDIDRVGEVCRHGTGTKADINSQMRSDVVHSEQADGKKLVAKAEGVRADRLDFDHVHVTWSQFLWCSYFVQIPAALQVIAGMFMVTVRGYLCKKGLWKPVPCDPAKVVGELLMETMQAVHYVNSSEQNGRTIGHFVYTDFPFLGSKGEMVMASEFIVDIDLATQKMTRAALNMPSGKTHKIVARHAMALISFNTVLVSHAKIHAAANWGLNVEAKDPFVRQNGIVSVVYNYFGKSGFVDVTTLLHKLGITTFSFPGCLDSIEHAEKHGIVPHRQIVDLMLYSDVVRFVVKARRSFLTTFEQHKEDMEDIDGEAMFIGTVLHSLDHSLWCKHIKDPLWFDPDDEVFGATNDVARIVRAGFADDLPSILFTKKYRDASHPFYKKFYAQAKALNQELADMMDTCIVK